MKFIRILGKILLVLLVVIATALGLVYWRSSSLLAQHIDVKEPALSLPSDADAKSRGEHLAITRGKGGIGARLDATSVERAIRHGLGEGGRLLLYMPATDFSGLTDADTAD